MSHFPIVYIWIGLTGLLVFDKAWAMISQAATQEPNASAIQRRQALQERAAQGNSEWAARKKWGKAIDAGFAIIPDVLIRAQRVLELDSVDLAIILNLVMHWWRADELPYPRPAVIARRIGVSTRTVERRIAALEMRGLITRLLPEKSQDKLTIRRFDLSNLVMQLGGLSDGNLADRPSRRKNNDEARPKEIA